MQNRRMVLFSLPICAGIIFATVYLFFSPSPTLQQRQQLATKQKGPGSYPSEWAMLQRVYPYGTADANAHIQALQAANEMKLALRKSTEPHAVWEFAGPSNIGGRISALAFNPQDPRIVYAGAATGGVFKSTDEGRTWFPVFDDQAVLPIGDVAVDPRNPSIVYAGTGEANGGHNNFRGGGLFKSTNGGATWRYIGLAETLSISRIVVHPRRSERVYAAAIGAYFGQGRHRGIFRSNDGGETWQHIFFANDSTGVIDLVMHPENPDTLFAAAWLRYRPFNGTPRMEGPPSGIYRSYDGGESWERLGAAHGLPGPQAGIGRIGLTLCASQPQQMYALYTDGYNHLGLYRSRDGGNSWQQTDPERRLRSGSSGFSWFFGQVRVHPQNPDKVFVLDVVLMGSEDGGESWPIFKGNTREIHVDHHALIFHPDKSDFIIDGNDGGIYLSQNGGYAWQKVENLPVTQFYNISYDPSRPRRLYGGTQDNGTIRTVSGDTDDWQQIYGGDGFYVIVDPINSDIIYAESQFGNLVKSTNRGFTWTTIANIERVGPGEPRNWATPVVMAPQDNNVLYYGTLRVYKTWNGGRQWSVFSPVLTGYYPGSLLGTVTTIALSPTDTSVVYAGTDDARVWVTSDAGNTWDDISAGLPQRWVTRIAVDPLDADIAYATFSGLKWNEPQPHVFRTTNRGATWQDISNNLPDAPVNCLVIDPADRNRLFVGTDVGAFTSTDAGQQWSVLGLGKPTVSVYDMVIDTTNRVLIAGTHGRSMYRITLGTPTHADPQAPAVASFRLAQNYPNPFNAGTRIEFELAQPEHVSLKIYNVLGEEVAWLAEEPLGAGVQSRVWQGNDSRGQAVPAGVYFYRITTPSFQAQKRMVLLR